MKQGNLPKQNIQTAVIILYVITIGQEEVYEALKSHWVPPLGLFVRTKLIIEPQNRFVFDAEITNGEVTAAAACQICSSVHSSSFSRCYNSFFFPLTVY